MITTDAQLVAYIAVMAGGLNVRFGYRHIGKSAALALAGFAYLTATSPAVTRPDTRQSAPAASPQP